MGKNKFLFFVFGILLVSTFSFVLAISAAGDTGPESGNLGPKYFVGDTLKVDLRGFGEYTVRIYSPQGSYLQKGTSEYFYLELAVVGKYTVKASSKHYQRTVGVDVFERSENKEPLYYDLDGLSYSQISAGESEFFFFTSRSAYVSGGKFVEEDLSAEVSGDMRNRISFLASEVGGIGARRIQGPIYAKDLIEMNPEIESISYNDEVSGEVVGYINFLGGMGKNFLVVPGRDYEIISTKNLELDI